MVELGLGPCCFYSDLMFSPISDTSCLSWQTLLVVHSELISGMLRYIISHMGSMQPTKSLRSDCQIDVMLNSAHGGQSGRQRLRRWWHSVCLLTVNKLVLLDSAGHTAPLERASVSLWVSIQGNACSLALSRALSFPSLPALASFLFPEMSPTTFCFLLWLFHFPLLFPPLPEDRALPPLF